MRKNKIKSIDKVKSRIRAKIKGTPVRPRLSIFRSNTNIYAQIIDDVTGRTLTSSSSIDLDIRSTIVSGATCEASKIVGTSIAKKSIKNKITNVVFDRGGLLYHGRIKALADAAREEGLQF
jgi:large subunit ribosomal protein L18